MAQCTSIILSPRLHRGSNPLLTTSLSKTLSQPAAEDCFKRASMFAMISYSSLCSGQVSAKRMLWKWTHPGLDELGSMPPPH